VRILLVSHGYPPRELGGVELQTAAIARGLAAAGHDVQVLAAAPERNGTFRIADEIDGDVQVRRLHVPIGDDFARRVVDPWVRAQFEALLDEARPDVVHVQHLLFLSADCIAVAAARRIPVVVTLHDAWWLCPELHLRSNPHASGRLHGVACWAHHDLMHLRPSRTPQRGVIHAPSKQVPRHGGLARRSLAAARGVARAFPGELRRPGTLRRALGLADVVLAPSGFLADAYAAAGFARPRVAAHGIELAREAAPPVERPVRFGFVGPATYEKGAHLLADALPEGSTLVHWGRGTIPGERVEHRGEFTPASARDAYRSFDVLVVPSLVAESFSLVTAEAQALGIPVVASRIGALPELVEHDRNGLLVEPGDGHSLAAVLARLTDPAEVARLGGAASMPRTFADQLLELQEIYAGAMPAMSGQYL
jgi:glycosyltransferase involved in cell wall biosynthesis